MFWNDDKKGEVLLVNAVKTYGGVEVLNPGITWR
jgi:hypothetical protein